jgi:hypothetical protein
MFLKGVIVSLSFLRAHLCFSADSPNAYYIIDKGGCLEGFHWDKLLASHVHLHLGSLPSIAVRFIENCQRFQESQEGA